jgi:hypothetical protein
MAKGIFRRHWFPPPRHAHVPAAAATAATPLPWRKRPAASASVFRRRKKWFPRPQHPHAVVAATSAPPSSPFRKRPTALTTAFRRRKKWFPPPRHPHAPMPSAVAAQALPLRKRPAALAAVFRKRKKWFPPARHPHAPLVAPPAPSPALPCRKPPIALAAVFRRRKKWFPRRHVLATANLASLGFGFARHYTGVLTPLGTKRVDQYSQIATPPAPALSQIAGGALAATTYYAVITYVSPSGETTPSTEASLAVAGGNLLRIAAPVAAGNATGWNVYVGMASGAETQQSAQPIAFGSAWTEPLSGLIAGAVPPSSNTTGWDVFNIFVPDPIAAARYTTNPIDTGFDDDLRVQAEIVAGLGPGQSGGPAIAFSIDTWLTNQSDPLAFTLWTIGFLTMRHLRGRIDYNPVIAGAVSYLEDLIITIDTSPRVESGGSFDVALGGSVLTFPAAYHFPPFMPAPNVLAPSGAGYYATATNLSAAQATITIFDHTGASVAGTVSWSATGE